MASFFRKRIAHKVLSMLLKKQELKIPSSPNHLSSLIKVNRFKSSEAQLILPWKSIEQIYSTSLSVDPEEVVRLLRNQGLPTAEGFIDIELSKSPPSLVFTVDKHIFSKLVLLDIFNNEDDLAKSSCLFEDIKKKNVIVQCRVPPFGERCHLSHFRSLIHSNYVANINKFAGHNVTRIAHVNDWGPKAGAFCTGFKQFKTSPKQNNSHLLEIYKAAILEYNNDLKFKLKSDMYFSEMKQGNTNEWYNLRQMCFSYYDSIYKKIGVYFDELYFDSHNFQKSEEISHQLSNIVLNEDGIKKMTEDLGDNEYISDITNFNSVLYDLSRHISCAVEMKEKYNFDAMYYVGPTSDADFFSTLFYLIKKLNYPWADDLHQVKLKMISSFDSKRMKMSIENILDHIKDAMMLNLHENLQFELNESLEEMAEQLSVSSLIINDMKHRRNVDYDFSFGDIINFKKDTAASFQFCYAGLKGLQEDSEYIFKTSIDTSPLLEPEAHRLIQHLSRFDEMVYKSYLYLEPCILFQYLSSLWYFTDKVTNTLKLDIKNDRLIVIKARLMLLSATQKVLNEGLHILGITPLEKMYSPEKAFVNNS